MGSAETALALQLTARQASDFELLANGGFAPLTGFLGSADWRSVCDDMRLASRRDLADPDHAARPTSSARSATWSSSAPRTARRSAG